MRSLSSKQENEMVLLPGVGPVSSDCPSFLRADLCCRATRSRPFPERLPLYRQLAKLSVHFLIIRTLDAARLDQERPTTAVWTSAPGVTTGRGMKEALAYSN